MPGYGGAPAKSTCPYLRAGEQSVFRCRRFRRFRRFRRRRQASKRHSQRAAIAYRLHCGRHAIYRPQPSFSSLRVVRLPAQSAEFPERRPCDPDGGGCERLASGTGCFSQVRLAVCAQPSPLQKRNPAAGARETTPLSPWALPERTPSAMARRPSGYPAGANATPPVLLPGP